MNTVQKFQGFRALLLMILTAVSLSVLASVPTGTPKFTHPLTITNRYQPFQPGGVKVFNGMKDEMRDVVTDLYLRNTREFQWKGASVACRILEEVEFESGQLVEISKNHFAQADDGTVYYFGEIVDIYENGIITSHDGSWIVGARLASDPPDTAIAKNPTVFMPANPELGDRFKQEDLFPIVDETDEIQRVGMTATVPAGHFTNVIQVLETTKLDPTDKETKLYAPGVGVVSGTAADETSVLIASSVREQ